VLDAGCDDASYASQLVKVAWRIRDRDFSAAAVAVAMVRAGRNSTQARVASILNRAIPRTPAGLRARLTVILAAVILLIPLSVLQAAKTHRMGETGLTPPKVASKVDPQYTEDARAAKIQGTTVLTMVVNEKGLAEKIKVKSSLNKGLDANAVAAVKQWHFEPGTLNGKPVRVAATIEVNFKLL
jgi:TonB family protein